LSWVNIYKTHLLILHKSFSFYLPQSSRKLLFRYCLAGILDVLSVMSVHSTVLFILFILSKFLILGICTRFISTVCNCYLRTQLSRTPRVCYDFPLCSRFSCLFLSFIGCCLIINTFCQLFKYCIWSDLFFCVFSPCCIICFAIPSRFLSYFNLGLWPSELWDWRL